MTQLLINIVLFLLFSAEETNEPKFSNQLFVLPVIYTARIIIRGGGRDTIVHEK